MVMYSEKEKSEEALGLESAVDATFVASLKKLGETPKGTIRLFDRSDFFSAHGSDALYIAKHHYKTQSVLKYLGKQSSTSTPVPSCTLSNAVAKSFLRDALTTKQLRIEIYSADSKSSTKWKLDKSASPGNLGDVEDLLFANTDMLAAPVILALKLVVGEGGVKTVGVAFADTSLQEMGVSEFVDNDLFSNTESLLIQLGVKEILLPADEKSSDYDLTKIRVLVEKCGIVITDRKRSDFNAKDVEQDLNRLLRDTLGAVTRPEFDLKIAMASTQVLISYLGLMTNENNFDTYHLKHHDLTQFMKLDASAVKALNLMPDPTGMAGANKNMSLYGLLNKCKTSQGMRLLTQWLKQPLVNLHDIEKRQDLVEIMYNDPNLRMSLSNDFLKSMPDFHRISKRFQKRAANLEDVVRVYQALLLLPGLISLLESYNSEPDDDAERKAKALVEEAFIVDLRTYAEALKTLEEMVETTIDLDELDKHNYVIKPEFDDGLTAIKADLDKTLRGLDKEHRTVARDLDMDLDQKVLHFENDKVYGYCFRLTKKEAVAIKNKKGYYELGNKANGVHFTTRALKEFNEEFKSNSEKYKAKQGSLVKEVITIAASYCEVLETLNTLLATIDVIVSLAIAAANAPTAYVKPTVKARGEGSLLLENSRHPCLEVQDGVNFIPNNISLERDVSEFQIITGPNMGGKSTFIRQAGVVALMAQIGSYVPCETAVVPIFDSILCRVGAGDSQLKGVSTFMAEMLETAAILQSATRDSLVIIDELGRGTSTYDGFGLAWAISEHLATETRASVLFASHFHELTALAAEIPHVKNLHVSAHVETKSDSLTGREITLLYKVQEGVCDQSFGIHVAQSANFPDEVILLAKRKADDLEDFSENPTEASITSTIAPETIAEGTSLVGEMLADWAKREPTAVTDEAGDIAMDDEGGKKEGDIIQIEYDQLKKCFEEYRERLENNEWTKDVLSATY